MRTVQIIIIAFFVSLLFFATHLTAGLLLQERKYPVKKTALLWGSAGIFLFLEVCFSFLLEEMLSLDHIWLRFLRFTVRFILWRLSACAERDRYFCLLCAGRDLWHYLFCGLIRVS